MIQHITHSCFVFPYLFCRSPCSPSDALFLFRSFCPFVLSFLPFVSWIAFFAFLFASLLSLVADSVILLFRLGAIPPRAPCEPEVCVFRLRDVFFLSGVADVIVYFHPVFFLGKATKNHVVIRDIFVVNRDKKKHDSQQKNHES